MLLFISIVASLLSASLARAAIMDIGTVGPPTRFLEEGATKRAHICQPFYTNFSPGTVSQLSGVSPFVSVGPQSSYEVSDNGLQMFLRKPQGPIVRQGHVNNVVADGATINSTFFTRFGKITFRIKAPMVSGTVTAAIMISDGHDEIDVELLGGDEKHWQTNVYAPSPKDTQPLWGIFGEIHDVPKPSSVTEFHNYTIDWNAERIIWSVDGRATRTLKRSETNINGTLHYPDQPSRIQLGVWDASNPEGTSEWAKGPIDWQKAPSEISATVRSVSVECT